MLQRIANWFKDNRPKIIPAGNNVLVITAFPKDGIVAVTYNGKLKRGKFDDNTLREMVYGKDFKTNAISFFSVAAELLEQLIIKK